MSYKAFEADFMWTSIAGVYAHMLYNDTACPSYIIDVNVTDEGREWLWDKHTVKLLKIVCFFFPLC